MNAPASNSSTGGNAPAAAAAGPVRTTGDSGPGRFLRPGRRPGGAAAGCRALILPAILAVAAVLPAFRVPAAAPAGEVVVAAASDLQFAMKELAAAFEGIRPDIRVETVYGSSGTLFAQIREGAPFDIFLSADMSYPEALHREGLGAAPPAPYATGRIVLWTRRDSGLDPGRGLRALLDPRVERIAIAHPDHAPYGRRAREILVRSGLWEAVRGKIVLGENVAQAAQFARTGNAQAALIALSLAQSPSMREAGRHHPVDAGGHAPMKQGWLLLKRAGDNRNARAFAAFLTSAAAGTILRSHGFAGPGP